MKQVKYTSFKVGECLKEAADDTEKLLHHVCSDDVHVSLKTDQQARTLTSNTKTAGTTHKAAYALEGENASNAPACK
jgi:hypothetical protein